MEGRIIPCFYDLRKDYVPAFLSVIMEITILGSGGCTRIQRPGCGCPVCTEARQKGIPYSRSGPSLFLHDSNALFDTPEDIFQQLNREDIDQIESIFYTHWHPDHTLGMRVIEHLNMDFYGEYMREQCHGTPIRVCAVKDVMEDLLSIQSIYGSFFTYYATHDLIALTTLTENCVLKIDSIEITPILTPGSSSPLSPLNASLFVITDHEKKMIYASSHCAPFDSLLTHPLLQDSTLLIIGDILPEGPLKGGYRISPKNPLREEMITLHELVNVISQLGIERTIVVHIEEEWGKSYTDYRQIEEQYREHNIYFGYDGQKIHL